MGGLMRVSHSLNKCLIWAVTHKNPFHICLPASLFVERQVNLIDIQIHTQTQAHNHQCVLADFPPLLVFSCRWHMLATWCCSTTLSWSRWICGPLLKSGSSSLTSSPTASRRWERYTQAASNVHSKCRTVLNMQWKFLPDGPLHWRQALHHNVVYLPGGQRLGIMSLSWNSPL